jgi:hypothetical protein
MLIADDDRDQDKTDLALEGRDLLLCQRQRATECSERRDASRCRA